MLGPGLLFAGAAVGVSHLVQSTRAGADYGLALIWVVFIAHFLKYPFYEYGPRYATVTGESLVKGYKRLGNGTLVIFALITLGTMFAIQAAVTSVTAGLAIQLFGISDNMLMWSIILLFICLCLLVLGRYSFLDNIIKIIILLLTISTIVAVGFAFSSSSFGALSWEQTIPTEGVALTFLIAFMGWMPAPIDISVWHSLWVLEKRKDEGADFDFKQSIFDFRVGYIGTMFLATCFVLLGALVMFGTNEVFSPKAGVFAKQLINLYTNSLGDWAKWIIGIAAFTTMFSTTLTCLDALPRTMGRTTALLWGREEDGQTQYWLWMFILIIGTIVVLGMLVSSMGMMVKIATILSFLTAPLLAWFNFKLVTSEHMPEAYRPGTGMQALSWVGMIFLLGFGGLYLFTMIQ